MTARGVFITGTDTGVGKTFVAAGLARTLATRGERVGVFKPVETGAPTGRWPRDAALLAKASTRTFAEEHVVPYRFEEPLAPLIAARKQAATIDIETIVGAYERMDDDASITLVEGAGGLSVQITGDTDIAGLAKRLTLPLLVVARPGLGTLNHTFLTVTYARAAGLNVLGIITCATEAPPTEGDIATRTNPVALQERCDAPLLGQIPFHGTIAEPDDVIAAAADAIGTNVDLDRLLEAIDAARVG